MNQRDAALHFTFFLLWYHHTSAQPMGSTDTSQQQQGVVLSFKPTIAVVFGIFSVMFSLTLVVLTCAKFCRRTDGLRRNTHFTDNRFSGLDKATIEALPFFKFSYLKGTRDGLECAVCLSRFEDSEVLRLLPKCKHAFHIACIDRWLERHSTCPLCRCKVEIEDITFFKYSTSSRLLFREPSPSLTNDAQLELLVEREANAVHRDVGPSSMFGIGESFRKVAEWGTRAHPMYHKEGSLLAPEDDDGKLRLHRFKHRVVVSDVVFKNRWSDLNSSDLTSLNSDMLSVVSSRRFSAIDPFSSGTSSPAAPLDGPEETVKKIKDEMEKKRSLESKARQITAGASVSVTIATNADAGSSIACSGAGRSMSEITNVSRFQDQSGRHQRGGAGTKNETTSMVWLPIARRTIQWRAGRDERPRPLPAFLV